MSPPRPGDRRAESLLAAQLRAFPGDDLPVPVDAIAEDLLGLRVRVTPTLGVSGMLIPAERLVHLDATEPPVRRRFTLAHEIGHWVVHCPPGAGAPPILCRATDVAGETDLREREANVFAADLLMPAGHVRRLAVALAPDAGLLAARFDVSEPAMAWRLYNLGLGPEPSG